MTQISPAAMKPHLSLAAGDTGADTQIQEYIDAAEAWVVKHLRRDLDVEFPGGWPAPILQAVRMLVAHWFVNPEASAPGSGLAQTPFGVAALLAGYRDLGA